MIFAGIDLSINSSALCIETKSEYIFHFTKLDGYKYKKGVIQNFEILENCGINYIFIENYCKDNKLLLYEEIVDKILSILLKYENIIVGIENISYSIVGNKVFELSNLNFLLQYKLYKSSLEYFLFPPLTIKRTSFFSEGKIFRRNDIRKESIIKNFLEYIDTDEKLKNSNICNCIYDLNIKSKPVDDIVDGFWTLLTLKKHYKDGRETKQS